MVTVAPSDASSRARRLTSSDSHFRSSAVRRIVSVSPATFVRSAVLGRAMTYSVTRKQSWDVHRPDGVCTESRQTSCEGNAVRKKLGAGDASKFVQRFVAMKNVSVVVDHYDELKSKDAFKRRKGARAAP